MSEFEIHHGLSSDPLDADLTEYRAVSTLAVVGLIVGLLSPLAFGHPFLWLVPVAGILLCALALWRIAREDAALIGRKAALVGLVVSVLCLAAAASERWANRLLIDAEARRFAVQWFEALRRDEPLKAYQMSQAPGIRLPLSQTTWDDYPRGSARRENVEAFIEGPEIRTLMALGEKAHVRYYDTERYWSAEGRHGVDQVWAVTFQENGQKKTFFVSVSLERSRLESTGRAYWTLVDSDGGVRPRAMKEEAPGSQG
jgi:hypothetical protein